MPYGLVSKKDNHCRSCIPNITNGCFPRTFVKGIDDIAEMYKYNIVLANSDEDDDKEISVWSATSFSKRYRWITFDKVVKH